MQSISEKIERKKREVADARIFATNAEDKLNFQKSLIEDIEKEINEIRVSTAL